MLYWSNYQGLGRAWRDEFQPNVGLSWSCRPGELLLCWKELYQRWAARHSCLGDHRLIIGFDRISWCCLCSAPPQMLEGLEEETVVVSGNEVTLIFLSKMFIWIPAINVTLAVFWYLNLFFNPTKNIGDPDLSLGVQPPLRGGVVGGWDAVGGRTHLGGGGGGAQHHWGGDRRGWGSWSVLFDCVHPNLAPAEEHWGWFQHNLQVVIPNIQSFGLKRSSISGPT